MASIKAIGESLFSVLKRIKISKIHFDRREMLSFSILNIEDHLLKQTDWSSEIIHQFTTIRLKKKYKVKVSS